MGERGIAKVGAAAALPGWWLVGAGAGWGTRPQARTQAATEVLTAAAGHAVGDFRVGAALGTGAWRPAAGDPLRRPRPTDTLAAAARARRCGVDGSGWPVTRSLGLVNAVPSPPLASYFPYPCFPLLSRPLLHPTCRRRWIEQRARRSRAWFRGALSPSTPPSPLPIPLFCHHPRLPLARQMLPGGPLRGGGCRCGCWLAGRPAARRQAASA